MSPMSIEAREMRGSLGPTPRCPACALESLWGYAMRHTVKCRVRRADYEKSLHDESEGCRIDDGGASSGSTGTLLPATLAADSTERGATLLDPGAQRADSRGLDDIQDLVEQEVAQFDPRRSKLAALAALELALPLPSIATRTAAMPPDGWGSCHKGVVVCKDSFS
eukprot:1232304-Amphidinium_carterae.2